MTRPRGSAVDRVDRLVRRTGFGLATVTLVLIAALTVAFGVVTASIATRALDDGVDRSLEAAAEAVLPTLVPEPPKPVVTPSPTSAPPTADAEPSERNDPGEGGEGGDNGDGSAKPTATTVPSPLPTATPAPTPVPTPAPTFGLILPNPGNEPDDRTPESADTFFLVLDPHGSLVANLQHLGIPGLPDAAAFTAAQETGRDLRTVEADGISVRLLTLPVAASNGSVTETVGYLQAGFVLTLHDDQLNQLLVAIGVAGAIGLLGAAIVTLLVTRFALRPIRSAFATERRFVAAASHELRTPVAIVRASAEIIDREGLVSPAGQPLVQDVIDESDRLSRLVADLLSLASSEAGAMTVDRVPLDLVPFLADVERRAGPVAAERGVRLTRSTPTGPVTVLADGERLSQLMLILLDNAFDHSPPGGAVGVSLQTVGGAHPSAEIAVSDDGPGVPAAERERIFEPFARLSSRRNHDGGSGLGLAIARTLADRHDATLRVEDAPGGGARFVLRLSTI